MSKIPPERVEPCPAAPQPNAQKVLGTSLVVNLDEFPELNWLPVYFTALRELQEERDRLTQEMEAIAQSGEVCRDQWIEPYSKRKNGKLYTYYQLRWLTGERKKSGQPKVKTLHLTPPMLGQIRAAIERGQRVAELEQQQQHRIDADLHTLKQRVRHLGHRLTQSLLNSDLD